VTPHDPVDRALALLRGEKHAELPDPALEQRLRRRAFELSRRRRFTFWPLLGIAVLSGAAVAASNLGRLRRWWFRIETFGIERSGVVEGDGERSFSYESAGGETGTVRLRREESTDGALRTELDVASEADDRVEQEHEEHVTGRRGGKLLPVSVLEGALSLHAATDANGEAHEIFALLDDQGGSRILVQHAGASVEELARVPFDVLREGGEVEIVELPGGGLELGFDDGRGAEIRFAWSCAGARAEPGPSVLETPDGKVRVQVGDAPLDR
jgi:hypothetical protein